MLYVGPYVCPTTVGKSRCMPVSAGTQDWSRRILVNEHNLRWLTDTGELQDNPEGQQMPE